MDAELDEPPEGAVALVREALEDQKALVRGHAVWALRRGDRAQPY